MIKMYKNIVVEILISGANLTKILKPDGEECFVSNKDLYDPKPTRAELYKAQVETIRKTPIAYQVAGWIASHESNIHVSTPPKQFDQTIEELISHGVDFEIGNTLTESTDATQGRSYSVVTDNHGLREQLLQETEIESTVYHDNPKKVSMQAKQFILDFLLDELKFKLGKSQNLKDIAAHVPVCFLTDFLRGTQAQMSCGVV